MLDLPQPFGPTIPVMPASKWMTVRSLNDLKPTSSSFLILKADPQKGAHTPLFQKLAIHFPGQSCGPFSDVPPQAPAELQLWLRQAARLGRGKANN